MRYQLVKISAWGALLWERLWPALWPAAALLAGLLALTLLDLWQGLPPLLGGVGLALYLALCVVVLVMGLWRFRFPTHRQVLRWIETRNGLEHRPLGLAEDRPATPQSTSSDILWEKERERATALRASLFPRLPHPRLAARDPWALRILALLVLVIAVMAGGGHWRQALSFLAAPPFGYEAEKIDLTAWLDPPSYTGKPPHTLKAEDKAPLDVPDGTKLNIRVDGARMTPVLVAAGQEVPIVRDKNGDGYVGQFLLHRAGEYHLRVGAREIAAWQLGLVKDRPPTAAFDGKPAVTARQSLNIRYRVADDYGVLKGELVLTRPGMPDVLRLPLPLPEAMPGEVAGQTYENLTAHPWAGSPVMARISVTDKAGQTGESEALALVLPEREFKNPVARQLVTLRKMLGNEPGTAPYVAQQLAVVAAAPQRFNDDLIAYLAIRTAIARTSEDDPAERSDTLSLMWDTALRIEDGSLSVTEDDMHKAIEDLRNALSSPQGKDMDKLMQQLREKMAEYMKSLAAKEQAEGQNGKAGDGPRQTVSERDLERMMQQIKDLAAAGSKKDAAQMLSRLQSMMENMKMASREDEARQQQAGAARQALDQLRRDQQKLMDETYSESSRRQNSNSRAEDLRRSAAGEEPEAAPPPPTEPVQSNDEASQNLGQRQEQIKAGLLNTARSMTPSQNGQQSLSNAARAMQKAQQSLQDGSLDDAVRSQAQALQSLAEAAQSFDQQMQSQGQGTAEDGQGGFGEGDPGSNVIPTNGDLGRARQILDEIRRRAGEWQRPPQERQYLDRLLDRF